MLLRFDAVSGCDEKVARRQVVGAHEKQGVHVREVVPEAGEIRTIGTRRRTHF